MHHIAAPVDPCTVKTSASPSQPDGPECDTWGLSGPECTTKINTYSSGRSKAYFKERAIERLVKFRASVEEEDWKVLKQALLESEDGAASTQSASSAPVHLA
ncbi:hypothetical protein HDU87_005390 [Geranomyces variabilis]|uniref:Uncharacterized protein n=1 Tax=Geranomyces variabilis TaxID=109894 RepID=A0AAD5TH92_9FUNG|nr:hypothetical protein HDU87_005390 [Geranomyces variabilis]